MIAEIPKYFTKINVLMKKRKYLLSLFCSIA
jgi:hypothetical protein